MSEFRKCCLPVAVGEVYDAEIVRKGVARGLGQRSKLWAAGETVRWFASNHSDVVSVRAGFQRWSDVCNLNFVEVDDRASAQIRVGFEDSGSWSFIGTDALRIPVERDTMNFGWPLGNDFGTVLHEIGHAVGMLHEHQSPERSLIFDEPRVLADLMLQGWDEAQVRANIFDVVSVDLSSGYDIESNMHYSLPPQWVFAPEPYASIGTPRNDVLSAGDLEWARSAYPFSDVRDLLVVDAFVNVGSGSNSVEFDLDGLEGRFDFGVFGVGESQLSVLEDGFVVGGGTNFGRFRSWLIASVGLSGQDSQVVSIDLFDAQSCVVGVWVSSS